MAAITTVSNLSFGARSVAFSCVAAGADTLDLTAVVAAAMLLAQPNLAVSPTPIYSFLTTTHTNAAGTAVALAQNGGILSAAASAAETVNFGGDNSLSISGAATVAVRIAFAASISA